jgi:hypothetical protein
VSELTDQELYELHELAEMDGNDLAENCQGPQVVALIDMIFALRAEKHRLEVILERVSQELDHYRMQEALRVASEPIVQTEGHPWIASGPTTPLQLGFTPIDLGPA